MGQGAGCAQEHSLVEGFGVGFLDFLFFFSNLITLISLRINVIGALFTTKFIAKPLGKCPFFLSFTVEAKHGICSNCVLHCSQIWLPGVSGLTSTNPILSLTRGINAFTLTPHGSKRVTFLQAGKPWE